MQAYGRLVSSTKKASFYVPTFTITNCINCFTFRYLTNSLFYTTLHEERIHRSAQIHFNIMCTQRKNNNDEKKTMDTANRGRAESTSYRPVRVRTATADPTPTQVGLDKSISVQDLQSLKKRDPFLYYSIPGVRDATVRLEDADTEMHQIAQNGLKTSASSIQSSGTTPIAKVERCTRVSFECHPDLLWDEIDEITTDNEEALEDFSPEDYLCNYLFKLL